MSKKTLSSASTEPEKWSFSRLNTVEQCLHQFELNYVEKLPGIDNAWSTIGSLIHDICEKFLKGKLTKFEAIRRWDSEYPWKMMFFNDTKLRHEFYYWNIRSFIKNVLPTLSGKIISVEEYFETPVSGSKDSADVLCGYIDLIVETEAGDVMVIDWKISKRKSFYPTLKKKKRQLYLYADHVKEKYGKIPNLMYFYLVAENDYICIHYDEKEHKEAWDWARTQIKVAKKAKVNKEFPANDSNSFFCRNLCGQRKNCKVFNNQK